MNNVRTIALALSLAVSGTVAYGAALPGQKTKFSTTQTAKIPGGTLTPGTYTIRVVDSLPDRYILEVSNAKDDSHISTFIGIPDAKLKSSAAGKPVYWKKGGADLAVRGIRLNGMSQTAAFVFPKEDAAALAMQVDAPVPAIDPESEHRAALPNMNEADRQVVTLWLLSTGTATPADGKKQLKATKYVDTVLMASNPKLPHTATASGAFLLSGFFGILLGGAFLTRRYLA